MMTIRKNWELDHTGGGNYSFIKNFVTKDKKKAMIMVIDLGASIPLHENGTFKTKSEYVEDFTYDYIYIINWVDEKTGYIITDEAKNLFSSNQLKEMKATCKHLDKLYEEGF